MKTKHYEVSITLIPITAEGEPIEDDNDVGDLSFEMSVPENQSAVSALLHAVQAGLRDAPNTEVSSFGSFCT